jgi:hypothetical protein
MINGLLLASQSVQALMTLLKAAQHLSNYNEIVAALSEVNARLMQANAVALSSQEKQSALTNRITELENQLREFENWESELVAMRAAHPRRWAPPTKRHPKTQYS